MLKPRRLACLVILFVGLTGVCLHPAIYWRAIGWSRGEAFYQGRPTCYWAEQFRNWPIPEDSWTHRFLPQIIASWFEPDGLPNYPGEAFYVNPECRNVVPAEAIPVLVELLGREEGDAPDFALDRLAAAASEENPYGIPEAVRAAVPKIVELLHSSSSEHCRYALMALFVIGRAAEAAVPDLIEVVREADTAQKEEVSNVYYALGALEEIGPGAREAIPVLKKLRDGEAGRKTIELKNGHVTLRSLASKAIQKIGGE